jgi:hypothetical protein
MLKYLITKSHHRQLHGCACKLLGLCVPTSVIRLLEAVHKFSAVVNELYAHAVTGCNCARACA